MKIKEMITKDKLSWCSQYHKKYMENSEENIHVDTVPKTVKYFFS